MNATFLWVKAFHIVFVASWFAGLFYLPRIFVNLAMVEPGSEKERQRLLLMARKLHRFNLLLMLPALALGIVLWWVYGVGRGPGQAWLTAKLVLVAIVLGYQHVCARQLRAFEQGQVPHGHRWYRAFNEIAVLLFAAVVVLVVVKPF